MNEQLTIKSVYYIRQSAVISGTKQWREAQHIKWIKNAGYDVTLICSSFDHYKKTQREKNNVDEIKSYQIWSPGYRRNRAIMRVIDAWIFSVNLFFFLLRVAGKNDMFICSFPTPEAAFSTKLVSLFKGNRVVFDFRDAWPDAYGQKDWLGKGFAFYINFLIRFILIKQSKMRILFMSHGIRHYYHSKFKFIANEFVIHNSILGLEKTVSTTNQDAPIIFVGSINNQFSFDELLDLNLDDDHIADISIVGGGEKLETVKQQFANFKKVSVLGPISYTDAMKKLASARAIFFFYSNPSLFDNHITNKVTEAISLGIPIITNLKKPSFDIWDDTHIVGVTTKETNIRDIFQKNFTFPELPSHLATDFSEDRVKEVFLEAIFTASPSGKCSFEGR